LLLAKNGHKIVVFHPVTFSVLRH